MRPDSGLPGGEKGAILSQDAEVAQLVERNLAKVEVAGSSPVFRSSSLSCLAVKKHGDVAEWIRHGSAKPVTPVRFRTSPPG